MSGCLAILRLTTTRSRKSTNLSRARPSSDPPSVAAVDAHDGVHRRVRPLRQLTLHLRVVGGQAGERGQVAACGRSADRDEVAVAAELVDVGARPRDRGLDVGHVRRPGVVRRHPIVDGQTYPAEFGQVRHQRVALQQATAVHPGAAGHEDQHRCGFERQIVAAPHVEQLGRPRAVLHGRPVDAAAVLTQSPQRGHPSRARAIRSRGPWRSRRRAAPLR